MDKIKNYDKSKDFIDLINGLFSLIASKYKI